MVNHIRVLVAGCDDAATNALLTRLMGEPDIDVNDHRATGHEAVRLAAECAPDVIVLHASMPNPASFEVARSIRQHHPAARIVFLCNEPQDSQLEKALNVQAQGFVCGREAVEEVVSAIREIVAGGAYFSEEIRSRLIVGQDGIRLARPK